MTTQEFCARHNACREGRVWAAQFDSMSDCWAALVADAKHYDWAWWTITRPDVLTPQERALLACDMVRNTPIGNGRTVWGLLTDERSRRAIEVAEAWARGEATKSDLAAAWASARVAARAAARAAEEAYAWDTRAAVDASTWSDAKAARTAAESSARAAWGTALEAAREAAWGTALEAARAAWTAARAWQVTRLRARPNPFREVTA